MMGGQGCHPSLAGVGGADCSREQCLHSVFVDLTVCCPPLQSLACSFIPGPRSGLIPGQGGGGVVSACEAGLEFSAYLLSQGGQSKIDPGRKKRSEAKRGRFLCQAGRCGTGAQGDGAQGGEAEGRLAVTVGRSNYFRLSQPLENNLQCGRNRVST